MVARRTHNTRSPRASEPGGWNRPLRHNSGMIRSFDTMVASATDATMTMPVAAEKPPTYTASASPVEPRSSGSASTYASGDTNSPASTDCPAIVIGNHHQADQHQ